MLRFLKSLVSKPEPRPAGGHGAVQPRGGSVQPAWAWGTADGTPRSKQSSVVLSLPDFQNGSVSRSR